VYLLIQSTAIAMRSTAATAARSVGVSSLIGASLDTAETAGGVVRSKHSPILRGSRDRPVGQVWPWTHQLGAPSEIVWTQCNGRGSFHVCQSARSCRRRYAALTAPPRVTQSGPGDPSPKLSTSAVIAITPGRLTSRSTRSPTTSATCSPGWAPSSGSRKHLNMTDRRS
jgi:hypothetical protein